MPLPATAAEPPSRLVDIAVGGTHACVLQASGQVWCWGARFVNGQETGSPIPMRVEGLRDIRAISAGLVTSCAIDRAGALSCWGLDVRRSIQLQRDLFTAIPLPIAGIPPVREISVGYLHICALTEAGQVYCWGANPAGEVGNGTTEDGALPQRVPDIDKAISVSAGINNSCAVESTGEVKCWGTDDPYRLGESGFAINSRNSERVYGPVAIGRVANGRNYVCGLPDTLQLAVFGGGHVICWGSVVALPKTEFGMAKLPHADNSWAGITMIYNQSDIVDFDVGAFTGCAVHADGHMSCWAPLQGAGEEGQPFRNNVPVLIEGLEMVRRVSIGVFDAGCVLVGEHEVACWGEDIHKRQRLHLRQQ